MTIIIYEFCEEWPSFETSIFTFLFQAVKEPNDSFRALFDN